MPYDESFISVDEYLSFIERFREENPEIDGLLTRFGIMTESYERFVLASIQRFPITESLNTTEGAYYANVSGTAESY